ncbi:MAG: class I SAM-dependent methyltransferase [Pirellulaceae bacterium]|nr:class I SAM-dependent methyltransferase [Pirellulaceae bacterium]
MAPTTTTTGSTQLTLSDYQWLVGEAARPWLQLAAEGSGPMVAHVRKLRQALGPARCHLVLEQAALRRRARTKYPLAEQLFFTDKGLQQATGTEVALYKAGRWPPGLPAADLCCGLGGDLMALARRGPVVAYDRDPIVALLADANCRAAGCSSFEVRTAAAEDCPLAELGAWHVDPDRRPSGHRVLDPIAYLPDLLTIEGWLQQNPHSVVKLAPAAVVPPTWQAGAEREWIGSRGECRQQVCWWGSLARHPGRRVATVLASSDRSRTLVSGDRPLALPLATGPPLYLCEPHNAVLAAGLVAELAAEYGLNALAADVAYLVSPRAVDDPALACFEVLEDWPFDLKRIRSALRHRRIGQLEVKKRGLKLDPPSVRQSLRPAGDQAATLLIAPHAGQVRAFLARRLSANE